MLSGQESSLRFIYLHTSTHIPVTEKSLMMSIFPALSSPSHPTTPPKVLLFSSPPSENTYISSLQSVTLSVSTIPFRPFLSVVVIQLLSLVWLFVTPWTAACQPSLSWFPLIGLISLQSKGLSRVLSSTKVRKHQFFSAQTSLLSNSHIHSWLLMNGKAIAFR